MKLIQTCVSISTSIIKVQLVHALIKYYIELNAVCVLVNLDFKMVKIFTYFFNSMFTKNLNIK